MGDSREQLGTVEVVLHAFCSICGAHVMRVVLVPRELPDPGYLANFPICPICWTKATDLEGDLSLPWEVEDNASH